MHTIAAQHKHRANLSCGPVLLLLLNVADSNVDAMAKTTGRRLFDSYSSAAVCQIVLPGPEAAARAAAAAPAKKRNEAEATIADAVSKALHILGSLKQIVSLIAGCHTALAPGRC